MGIIKFYISLSLVLLVSMSVFAQETPTVHKINGNKYYLHVVEAGNTLYGISKMYNLSIDEIQKENPILAEEGLKVNQTLLIPVTSDNKKDLGAVVNQTEEFITHEAQPKETLYAISKQYNTTVAELLKANDSIKLNGLKVGDQVRIPIKKVETKEENVTLAKEDSLQSHVILKGETFYSLSKLYNTTVDELVKANPNVSLREGMAIRISGTRVPVKTDTTKDKLTQTLPELIETHQPKAGKPLSIGLLLPLSPSFPDSANPTLFQINEAKRVALSFYRGFEFAIDSLAKRSGVVLKLELFDVGQDTFKVHQLVKSGKLKAFDILVGPFYTDQFELIADYTKQFGIPTFCPIPKPSKILFKRPNAIKTTPSESMQIDAIAELLADKYADSNLILVNSNKFQDVTNIEFFKARYAEAIHLPDTSSKEVVREIKLWDINEETLRMRLGDSGSFTLFVPSTNKVFVTKLLGELYDLKFESKGKFNFRVIGLEEWQRYENDLDVKQLHELHVTMPIVGYLDFFDYKVKNFFKHYHTVKGYEPDRFTLVGFDLSHYIITQASYNRAEWFETPEKFQFSGVLMDYHFHRVLAESGIENQSIHLYEYKNYRLKELARWPIQKMK